MPPPQLRQSRQTRVGSHTSATCLRASQQEHVCRHVHVPQDVRGARPLSSVPRQAAVQGHVTE